MLPLTHPDLSDAAKHKPVAQGKVRDIFRVEHGLVFAASDCISTFNVVFDQGIPQTGKVLTQVSSFWAERLSGCLPICKWATPFRNRSLPSLTKAEVGGHDENISLLALHSLSGLMSTRWSSLSLSHIIGQSNRRRVALRFRYREPWSVRAQ